MWRKFFIEQYNILSIEDFWSKSVIVNALSTSGLPVSIDEN